MAKIDTKSKGIDQFIIYRSISFLPAFNFYEGVLKTNDYRYLLKLDSYDTLPDVSIDFGDIWGKKMDEVEAYKGGGQFNRFNSEKVAILKLRLKFDILKNSILILCARNDKEEQDRVINLGYKFNDAEYQESINVLKSKLSALGQNIQFKQHNFEAQFKQDNTTAFDYFKEVSNIEQYKKIAINPLTLTVRQYLVYQNELKDYIKSQSYGRRSDK